MMEFASQEETALAMVVTARWLPVLVRSFEKGAQDLGLAVTERSHFIEQDSKACPTLGVRGRRLTLRLGLGPSCAGSNTVTSGEPFVPVFEPLGVR